MKLTGESKVLFGILAVTVAIIGGAVLFFNTLSPSQKTLTRQKLVPPDSFTTGNPSAQTYLVEFSDFQCPACLAFAPAVEELVTRYADTLFFVYRHYPLSQHQHAKPAAMAAEAAGEQGKFWEMGKLLFENQDRFPAQPWGELADQLALDRKKFDESLNSKKLVGKVDRDEAAAIGLRLPGTPTFFLNGVRLTVSSPDDLKKAVERIIIE